MATRPEIFVFRERMFAYYLIEYCYDVYLLVCNALHATTATSIHGFVQFHFGVNVSKRSHHIAKTIKRDIDLGQGITRD